MKTSLVACCVILPIRAWSWAGDGGLIGAINAEGGSTTIAGIGGGSGAEVELYQLSGGDQR